MGVHIRKLFSVLITSHHDLYASISRTRWAGWGCECNIVTNIALWRTDRWHRRRRCRSCAGRYRLWIVWVDMLYEWLPRPTLRSPSWGRRGLCVHFVCQSALSRLLLVQFFRVVDFVFVKNLVWAFMYCKQGVCMKNDVGQVRVWMWCPVVP